MLSNSPKEPAQWWYASATDAMEGPLRTSEFVSLFESGLVDGLTKVSHDGKPPLAQWPTLAEHPLLRDAVRRAAAEDEPPELQLEASHLPAGPVRAPLAERRAAHPECDLSGRPHSAGASVKAAEGEKVNLAPGEASAPTEAPIRPEGSVAAASPPASPAAKDTAANADAEDRAASPDIARALARERKRQSRKRARDAKRLRKHVNTSVYVTGVPRDASERELAAHFAKCGILQPNADTGQPRAKMYRDASGRPKGDALVTYAMEPSVANALALLDGAPLRVGGERLQVVRASFDHKQGAEGDAGEAPARKLKREDLEAGERRRRGLRNKALVTEALSWDEGGQEVSATQRIVILKNVFDASYADYKIVKEDMEEGCSACGAVEKVSVFERNAEGAVAVKFSTLEACVKCIEVMNGRWYDGRMLTAEFYDGVSDFRYKESVEDRLERERRWQEWLEEGENADAGNADNVGTIDEGTRQESSR